jgi:sarcosine oxidase, subunit beta
MPSPDVVVIGAGAVGCAAAHYLLRLDPTARVLIVEGEHPGAGSTSRSTAAFRHQWSVPAHVAFSRYASDEYDALAEAGHPIGFRRNGYLFLHASPQDFAAAGARAARQRKLGVQVQALLPGELPGAVACGGELRLEALAGAVWGPRDGFLDPLAAAHAYLAEARAAGAEYRGGSAAVGFESDAAGVSAVRLADGERLPTRKVICAAGVWSGPLLAAAGLPLPLVAAKRYLYHSRPVTGTALRDWPMVIAPGGAHTRPAEGNTLLLAWESRPPPRVGAGARELWEEQDVVDEGFGAGVDGYGVEVMAQLAPFLPLFEEGVSLAHVTCGWYAVTPDHKAILGGDPRLPGLFLACGFSGHGIMHCPASGLTVAELALGRPTSLLPAGEMEDHFGLAPLLEGRRREPVEEMVL